MTYTLTLSKPLSCDFFFCVFFLSIILSHFLLFLRMVMSFLPPRLPPSASWATVFTDFEPVKLSYSVKCFRKTLSFYALLLWLLIHGLGGHKQVSLTGRIGLQRKKKWNTTFSFPNSYFANIEIFDTDKKAEGRRGKAYIYFLFHYHSDLIYFYKYLHYIQILHFSHADHFSAM